jgi:multiple sugar transport system permease protein
MYETRGFRWVRRIGLAVLFAFVTWPLYVMVIGSFTSSAGNATVFDWWPKHLSTGAYRAVWHTIPLGRYLRNSAIVAAASAAIATATAIPAAYALARFRFAGRRLVAGTMLGTQFVPGLVFLVPLFLSYAQVQRFVGLHLIGSYTGLIVTDLTFALPFSIWLLAAYLNAQPTEIEDAARVDGAGTVTLLLRVVLPLAAPGIAAVALFAFALSWSEVLFASVLVGDGTTTVPIGVPTLVSQSSVYWNQLLAASLVSSVPVLAIFVGLRRFFVRGLVTRARS